MSGSRFITAVDAYHLALRRKASDSKTFLQVCSYVEKKIVTAASLGERDTICSIPMYLHDAPTYDQEALTEALVDHFRTQQFYVHTIHTTAIYISWRHANHVPLVLVENHT
jgi:hypothetical protein